jgi:FkbM family methyltransferase
MLEKRFAQTKAVCVHSTAMSSQSGAGVLYVNHEGSGTNSLHPISGVEKEVIALGTLDEFLLEHRISHVVFAKIDVEGFDCLVLQGAARALAEGAIDLIQFEYNWRWILNSQNLKNVFQLIEKSPYRLGKLAGNRILVFKDWHFEMDRFFENNYVLLRKGGPFERLGVEASFDASNTLQY